MKNLLYQDIMRFSYRLLDHYGTTHLRSCEVSEAEMRSYPACPVRGGAPPGLPRGAPRASPASVCLSGPHGPHAACCSVLSLITKGKSQVIFL